MHPRSALRLAGVVALGILGGCVLRKMDYSAARDAQIQVADAKVLKLNVGAGYLRVEGLPETRDILISGVAHAASAQALAAIQLATRRVADTIFVSGVIPASDRGAGVQPALDLTLQLPSSLSLQVIDSTGASVFRNVGALRIVHGDGGLDADTVTGNLDITDGGGDMVVGNVTGNVRIVDGAGSIYVSDITGSVVVPQDGPGEIQFVRVSGDVTVGTKRSGEVAARGIGGSLAITANGSGSIEYRDVKGRVTIPAERYH